MKRLAGLCVFLSFCSAFCWGAEAPFSVDILNLGYSDDAGRVISYDFTEGQVLEANRIEIPSSAVTGTAAGETNTTFLFESTVHDVGTLELFTGQGLSRLLVPHWHYTVPFDPDEDDMSDFASLGAFNAAQVSPANWTFQVRLSNFQHQDGLGNLEFRQYGVTVGMGHWNPLADCSLQAEWFTGWVDGTYVEDVLVIMLEVEDNVNDAWWESELVPLFDLDPLTTELELKLQIQNNTTLSAYYRLDDETAWQPVCEGYESPQPIPGFPAMFPTVDLFNAPTWHGIYKFQMEELSRMAAWWLDTSCDRELNGACDGMDINEDGQVGTADLAVLADYWMMQL